MREVERAALANPNDLEAHERLERVRQRHGDETPSPLRVRLGRELALALRGVYYLAWAADAEETVRALKAAEERRDLSPRNHEAVARRRRLMQRHVDASRLAARAGRHRDEIFSLKERLVVPVGPPINNRPRVPWGHLPDGG